MHSICDAETKDVEINVRYEKNPPFKLDKQYCFAIDKCIVKNKDGSIRYQPIGYTYVAITHSYCNYNPQRVYLITGKNKRESFVDYQGYTVQYYKPRCLKMSSPPTKFAAEEVI
jgi:hypothetical protein